MNALSPKRETEKLDKLQFTLPPSCSLFVSLSLFFCLSVPPPLLHSLGEKLSPQVSQKRLKWIIIEIRGPRAMEAILVYLARVTTRHGQFYPCLVDEQHDSLVIL